MTFRLQSVPGIVQQLEGSCWSTFSTLDHSFSITYSISASHTVLCDCVPLRQDSISCDTQQAPAEASLSPESCSSIGIPVSRPTPQLGAVHRKRRGVELRPTLSTLRSAPASSSTSTGSHYHLPDVNWGAVVPRGYTQAAPPRSAGSPLAPRPHVYSRCQAAVFIPRSTSLTVVHMSSVDVSFITVAATR